MKWIAVVQLLVSFFLLCAVFKRGSCCADGWLRHGEHCFRIYTKPLTKLMASAECFLQGSDLISISDETLFQFLSVQLQHLRGDRFWIGLQYDDEEKKLSWMDGTTAMEEPWVKPYIPEETSFSTSADTDCYAINGTLIVKNPCSENLGYICGHKRVKSSARTECNQNVDPEDSFIGAATGNCLFRTPEKTTKNKVEELCAEYQGHFVDLDVMMKDGLSAFYSHKVLANDGSKYWTGLTWNGTNVIWNDSLCDYFSIAIINGTGSCIAVQFNITEILETHLYQTDCDSEVQVVCSKTAESTENLVATGMTMNDQAVLSCPQGISWVENTNTGYCYWETAFDTERLPWDDAERYCQSFGGHLSSFHSLEEEKIGLGIQYGLLAQPYWIGLKMDPETETYKWSDDTPLNYTNWAPGHPDHEDKRLPCVAMDAKEKHWVSSLCGIHSWFICKVPKQVNPPNPGLPTPIPLQPCDSLVQVGQRIVSYFFEESCYFTVSESYNWHKAKQFCENEGATLASIHSVGEEGFLLKLLHESVFESNSVWIGLNILGSDGNFHWMDRSPVDFTYFNKDEPNNFLNQEKCCNMYTGNGLWNDENCNAEMSFICKRKNDTSGTTVIPISTPDPTIGNCKKGWISHHDRCYYLGGKQEKDRVNWTEALDICLAQGGYLTSVRDEKDQGFLSFLLQFLGVDAWIGLHDSIEAGRYYWMDNLEIKYTKWSLPEAYHSNIKKDCVKMVYDTMDSGEWKDEECEKKMGYICYSGKDPKLPAPSNGQGINCLQPQGWLRLGSMCFKMFGGNNLTWQEAETSCRMDGAHLVSVSDKGVKAVLSYLAAEVKMPFWIGLQYKESTQTVNWLNDWPVTLTSWDKNEPSFMKDDVCIASTSDGYWKKSSCTEKMPYVCQITAGKPSKQKECTGQCPSTAKHWTSGSGSYCYILERDLLHDWFTAKRACSGSGSQLSSIHSEEEINSLKKLMKSGIKSVFIGLIRTKNGGFRWIDDTPVNFVNWDEDQPKNFDDGCVEMMTGTMKWRVAGCMVKKHFVCQTAKEHSSQPPTRGQLKSELPTSTLAAIITGAMIALLLIVVVAVYLLKKSAGKKFHIISTDQSPSFDNALYDVKAAEMEF